MIIKSKNYTSGNALVIGTQVKYTCENNHRAAVTTSTCGTDGKWSSEVVCHRGRIVKTFFLTKHLLFVFV